MASLIEKTMQAAYCHYILTEANGIDHEQEFHIPALIALHREEPFTEEKDKEILSAIKANPEGVMVVQPGIQVRWFTTPANTNVNERKYKFPRFTLMVEDEGSEKLKLY